MCGCVAPIFLFRCLHVSSEIPQGVEMNTKKYIGLAYCLFCLSMLGYFYVLLLFPPIITAAVYTFMAAIIYRACHKIFTFENFLSSNNKTLVFSLACGILWPLYFLFGFFFFLVNISKRY